MALNTQLGGTPSRSDFPFFNFGVTAIPAGVAVKVDAANTVGAGQEGIGIVLASATTDPIVGVTVDTINPGVSGRVRTAGIAQCIADGAVTAGTYVMAGVAGGKVGYAKTKTAAQTSLGIALSTAVDADQVLVLLQLAPNA